MALEIDPRANLPQGVAKGKTVYSFFSFHFKRRFLKTSYDELTTSKLFII